MTLGFHVVSGSRNGYGPACSAKPAVVLAVDEGGALGEAKTKSSGHTYTVFRDTTVYLEAPPGWDTALDMGALARTYYPALKAKWGLNPADWYQITNERSGGEGADVRRNLIRLIAYEREIMRLANLDGLKVGVLSLAGGSPGDINLWKELCVPFIVEAWGKGNVYLRHAYGGGNLVTSVNGVDVAVTGNPSRPLEEATYLYDQGYRGGIVVSEAGIDGGYGYAGDRFSTQLARYAKLLRQHPLIIGCCAWTLGDWSGRNANCQDSLPYFTNWMTVNPHPKWVVPSPPVPPPTRPKVVVMKKPQKADITEAEDVAANKRAYDDYGRTITNSVGDMMTLLRTGNSQSYAILAYPERASQTEAMDALLAEGYDWINWPDITFRLSSPVSGIPLYITDPFNSPRDYDPIHKHHEGLDLRAIDGTGRAVKIVAAATGIVDGIRRFDPGKGYGLYVRTRHTVGNDTYYIWYGHLSVIPTTLAVGNPVTVGQELGTAGNTGLSLGIHLHLTVQKIPGGLPYYIVDSVIDPAPLLGLPGTTLPGPTAPTIDLLPYIKGDGRLYEVRTTGGGQERFQSQASGNLFWQTKNSQWEELLYDDTYIWRGKDTSPGPAPAYAERPGVPRYYTAKETGKSHARWCKRYMAIGEQYVGPGHLVNFFYKDNCSASAANSGSATNRTTLVAKHASRVWNGLTINDVVEMTNGTETWYFARGFGLVAWSSSWGSSAISEIHAPGTRPNNVRETGCFS